MKQNIERILKESGNPEEKIEKTVSLNYDGKQFFIRIPKKISDYLNLKKEDTLQITIDVGYIEETQQKTMVVELIEKE